MATAPSKIFLLAIILIFLFASTQAFTNSTDLVEEDFLDGTVMNAESEVNGIWFIKFYAPW